MPDEGARLTGLGKMLSAPLIAGIIGLGVWVVMRNQKSQGGPGGSADAPHTEAPDTAGVTTVKEYKYIPADKLPAVKGVSQYKWNAKDKALRFSYNIWAGWLPVI